MIVSSDLYQALYQDLGAGRKEVAVHSIGSKMTRAASVALDRTIERLDPNGRHGDARERFLIQTTNGLLEKLGFVGEARPADPQQQLHLHLTPEDIIAARERARIINGEESDA